jgi:hypothetical protein
MADDISEINNTVIVNKPLTEEKKSPEIQKPVLEEDIEDLPEVVPTIPNPNDTRADDGTPLGDPYEYQPNTPSKN